MRRVGIPAASRLRCLPFGGTSVPATSLPRVATWGGRVAQLRCVGAVLVQPHFRTRQKVRFF